MKRFLVVFLICFMFVTLTAGVVLAADEGEAKTTLISILVSASALLGIFLAWATIKNQKLKKVLFVVKKILEDGKIEAEELKQLVEVLLL